MSLKNLNQLGIDAQNSYMFYEKEEVRISKEFKILFTDIIKKNSRGEVRFSEFTTIVMTANELTITFPNQWFYIASFFVDFLNSLKVYKTHYNELFSNHDNIKSILTDIKKNKEVPSSIEDKINSYFKSENDAKHFRRFLTDYDWWFGSKTIDRSDYYISPILSLAKVVNVSQNYIAELTMLLSDNSQLMSLMSQSQVSEKTPKETDQFKGYENVIKSDLIRDFALDVFKYFYGESWDILLKESLVKNSRINDVEYELYDFGIFKNLIGSFEKPQDKNSLSSSNTLRYFEAPVYTDDLRYYYFTTQWNVNSDRSLSFENIKKHFENKYPNYSIVNRKGVFMLLSNKIEQENFKISDFKIACDNAGLIYSSQLLTRFAASLSTKPFVLLTGLSGSGKTKLAQAFAQWICECKDQYCIVPVGADWINREPLLGYVNALDNRQYILPENGALELILRANEDKKKPCFLVLDEMNLSHVERYFADFLSVMESKDKIKLHSAKENLNDNEKEGLEDAIEVPSELSWPENLFVIGTVNIDETTYMFSPKVLDRANVIEFRISSEELDDYFESNKNQLNMQMLCVEDTNIGKGAKYGESFVSIAKNKEATKDVTDLNKELKKFFEKLQEIGAEFGYRSASEIQILFNKLDKIDISYSSRPKDKIDIAIMQKLLPKLHGSRSKLVDVLFVLASFCYDRDLNEKELKKIFDKSDTIDAKVIYPISLEKINRMYRNVIDNGFTSYAEA